MNNPIETLKDDRRPIPGYEGIYSITRSGVVYSDHRVIIKSDGRKQTFRERIKKQSKPQRGKALKIMLNGYPEACISKDFTINSIMMATFPELYPPIENLVGEIWEPTNFNPNYSVSNKGRIKRSAKVKSIGNATYIFQECLMSLAKNGNTHRTVFLRGVGSSIFTTLQAVRLVYEAFIGEIPADNYIRYHDGDVSNLQASNLYLSKRMNRDHVAMNRDSRGIFIHKLK